MRRRISENDVLESWYLIKSFGSILRIMPRQISRDVYLKTSSVHAILRETYVNEWLSSRLSYRNMRARISVYSCNIVPRHGARTIFPLHRGRKYMKVSRDEFGIQLSVRCRPARRDPLRASCFVSKWSDVMRAGDGLNQKEYLHR